MLNVLMIILEKIPRIYANSNAKQVLEKTNQEFVFRIAQRKLGQTALQEIFALRTAWRENTGKIQHGLVMPLAQMAMGKI